MGIVQSVSEALSVKNLASMFYTGYTQVSPGKTRIEPVSFNASLNSKYNLSIADTFVNGDPRTSTLANILATIYTETYRTKKDLFDLYRSVKDLDQASVIIEDFIDDAFSTPDSDYPFTIKIKNDVYGKEEIEQELVDLVKKFDIYQLDRDTNEDFLVYGDYYLTTIPKVGEGIIDISDNVEIENVFSIYKNNKLEQHIGMNRSSMFINSPISGYAGQLKPIHPDLLSHFILDSRKIKIQLPLPDASIIALPENIRIGRSVIYSSLQLLKKYQLLDIALTYKEVRNALMPVLLGMSTGAFTTPDHMIEACKAMESYLSDGTAMMFDLENAGTIENMLQNSAGFKVAPVPGDKGQLNKIDVGQNANETSGLNNILNDTGNRIAITSGGVTQNESGKSRLEILKSNSRRSKRLIDIQRGKATGWGNLFHKHLRYKHINIERESIQINYKAIPNADIFEEANGLVTLLSVVNDLQTFSDSVKQSDSGYKTNPQKMIDAFNLFVGNRYPVIKDFLQLDVVRKQFPAAAELVDNMDKTTVATGSATDNIDDTEDDSDKVEIKSGVNNSAALHNMNKSFDGSSGSSDAVGH
jgi:hypothetical protein